MATKTAAATEGDAATGAEEPATIEVWRPAGRSDRRPHRARRANRGRTNATPTGTAEAPEGPVAAEATAQPADSEAPSRGRRRQHGDGPNRQARRDRHDRQRAEGDAQRVERQNRSPRRGPRRRREEGPDRAERERYYARPYGGGSDTRDRQPDPNSPFAKLAALKQQLEQGDKEMP